MKIFQIGFNKCGTASLYHFFKDNGLKSVHWRWGDEGAYKYAALEMKRNYENKRPLLEGMEEFDFYSDMESHLDGFDNDWDDYFPCVHAHIDYFKEMDKQYPNSRFILNVRNVDNWIKSRRSHVFGCGRTYLSSFMHHMKSTEEDIIKLWKNTWISHIENVLVYFKHRPKDLLVFNIEKDGPDKIKDFFSEDLDLNMSHWKQTNKTAIAADIGVPINVRKRSKDQKDKRGRVVLWKR